MNRRDLLRAAAAVPFFTSETCLSAAAKDKVPGPRVRPGDTGWPSAAEWDRLKAAVDGHLLKPESPFARCPTALPKDACTDAVKQVQNPYFLGDNPALTQSSGWVDAWSSQPSAYAVAARTTAHVVAAVNFAREHRLRLVVKGGGHSYQGTSSAPDSLLIWTRYMNGVTMHDDFSAQGCAGESPQPAVTLGSGAMWRDAYAAVTTAGSRYVQGGGCQTVGVAGLVQSGGFGSWSKCYGTAAGGLLEAEVVTADGVVRIANRCTHADLFWAIKGGGGGTFGVLTRVTLRTRDLPQWFGAVKASIRPAADAAYRALIAKALTFYRTDLMNPHWGEKMIFGSKRFEVSLLFQGLTQEQARSTWAPFFDWVRAHSEYAFVEEPRVLAVPARELWNPEYMRQHVPGTILLDDRAGTAPNRAYWAENREEAGQFLHGYKTAWLPAALLEPAHLSALVEALFAASRHWSVAFHFNKGLAGAPPEEIAAARETAMNPAALDAFACAFIAGEGPPAFAGLPGSGPDMTRAREDARRIGLAMDELLKAAPGAGSYVSESDYFQVDWQQAFWGPNYPRLAAIKRKYDPHGLFFVHHGVGSEAWSADGFTPV